MSEQDIRRERLNLRALRVSLASALNGVEEDRYPRIRGRANDLLDEARRRATDQALRDEIDALQAEWDRTAGSGLHAQDDEAR